MSEFFEIPENAITTFEQLTAMHVTVHDRSRSLWRFLPPDRFVHRISWCEAVKSSPAEPNCLHLARELLPVELPDTPEGQVHICPAGLIECVVPILRDGTLQTILFAGVALPAPGMSVARRYPGIVPFTPPWPDSCTMPDRMDDARALRTLEALRQLASRLSMWMDRWEQLSSNDGGNATELSRSMLIRRFVQQRHTGRVSLADIADALHLSESRAAHAIRESCGKTFLELVTEERIRTAADLLRATTLPVLEIAYRSGFGDLSHFHRTFKQHMGMTPRRYRTMAEVRPPDPAEASG